MSKEAHSIENEFEYNDGLGDLLKEKERQEFSWAKTVVVLASIITVVTLSFMVVFRVGRSLMVKAPEGTVSPVSVSQDVVLKTPAPATVSQVSKPAVSELQKPKQSVKPSAISSVSKPVNRPASSRSYTLSRVVVGSHKSLPRARAAVTDLKRRGVDSYVWIYTEDGQTYYRVQIGAFKNPTAAHYLAEKMREQYNLDAIIIKQ
ncbi:MAG: SPOR domain-containing protein [bacterium]|nr:SPOR domain-containing protein [bacterium]